MSGQLFKFFTAMDSRTFPLDNSHLTPRPYTFELTWLSSKNRLALRKPESQRPTLALRLALCLSLLCVTVIGCRKYPEVASPESQKLIQLFYTACNTQNVDRLQQAIDKFSRMKAEEKLNAQEINAFEKIIRLAEGSQWEEAARVSMTFAKDQIR